MNSWNLTGDTPKNQERVILPEMVDGEPKAYEGTITEISEPTKEKKYNSEDTEDKIKTYVEMDDKKVITFFCTFKVMKGSGSYSNSKLYDLIEVAKGLTLAQNVSESNSEYQLKFLRDLLVGKRGKFLVKAVNKGKDNEYSVVDKFTKIWDTSEVVKEDVE